MLLEYRDDHDRLISWSIVDRRVQRDPDTGGTTGTMKVWRCIVSDQQRNAGAGEDQYATRAYAAAVQHLKAVTTGGPVRRTPQHGGGR